jgi:hypothetical protein
MWLLRGFVYPTLDRVMAKDRSTYWVCAALPTA